MISSEEEFQRLMFDVNAEMIEEDIAVTARPIVAGCKVSKRLNVSMPMFLPGHVTPRPGSYSGIDLSLRINKWFTDLYGDKLKVDMDIGTVAILLSGEIYKMCLPTVFGSAAVIVDPTKMENRTPSGIPINVEG